MSKETNPGGMPDEVAAGRTALRSVLNDSVSNPLHKGEAVKRVLRDPLTRGIYSGFDNLMGGVRSPARLNMQTGLGLGLAAIVQHKDSAVQIGDIPDFVPDDLNTETYGSTETEEDAVMVAAGSVVIQQLMVDILNNPSMYQGRLNTALENPVCRGISNGFRELTPSMAQRGMADERIHAIHIGLDLALMAASAPYDLLSVSEVPDAPDFP